MAFEKIIDGILAVEKGYVDHPNDRGGPTNYGITLATARANGYLGDMREMPVDFARRVYAKRYIVDPGFADVAGIDTAIAEELIDTGVNMGPGRAAEFLQRALNSLNQGNRLGHDLLVDGKIGSQTLVALEKLMAWRGAMASTVMVRLLNAQQAVRYVEIADANPSQRDFMFGWIAQRVA